MWNYTSYKKRENSKEILKLTSKTLAALLLTYITFHRKVLVKKNPLSGIRGDTRIACYNV